MRSSLPPEGRRAHSATLLVFYHRRLTKFDRREQLAAAKVNRRRRVAVVPAAGPVCDDELQLYAGLRVRPQDTCRFKAYVQQMDSLRLPYTTHVGLLWSFSQQDAPTWDVYLHFDDWPVPVTAAIIQRLMQQFQRALDAWMAKLRGVRGFPDRRVRAALRHRVLQGRRARAGRVEAMRRVPDRDRVVRAGEQSPWMLALGAQRFGVLSYYRRDVELRAARRRQPPARRGVPTGGLARLRAPRGLRRLQTRYWHGDANFAAFAQRQYLRVSGVCAHPATGDFGANYKILLHEMGRCFFLDDLYDLAKYPSLRCVCRYAGSGEAGRATVPSCRTTP